MRRIITIAAAFACGAGALLLQGCYSGYDTAASSYETSTYDTLAEQEGWATQNESYGSNTSSEPRYADARWPTTNSELLAIPEENRYYNAWNQVWSTCTVAGPVVNVYQAKNERGAPIFISIGAQYPSPDCVTLVVWGDAYYDFAEMIDAVDDGGAWLSVTGYLSEYNGNLQFNTGETYVSYTWWTNVS